MAATPQISSLGQFFLRSPRIAAVGSGAVVVLCLVPWDIPLMIAVPIGLCTTAVQWILWRGGDKSFGYRIKQRQAERRAQ